MSLPRSFVAALALTAPLALGACVDAPLPSVAAADEISRLQGLGYRVTARGQNGGVVVLRYSGKINASVRCGGRNAPLRVLSPRVQSASGAVQDFELNTYLVLNPGSDGVISAGERDGLYVVTKSTRPSARSRASEIQTITFEPGGRGTFPSGLSCRAA